tara:strand:- start:43 stop:306 length:264 start_codon:yes stop_codon:yes gene_type:complete
MKILAGGLLYNQKANNEEIPAHARVQSKYLPFRKKMKAKQDKINKPSEAASPSKPSVKLKELIIKMITDTEKTIEKISGNSCKPNIP